MQIVWTLLIGLLIGLVARMLKPGADSMGLIATALVGAGGSLLGNYAVQLLGFAHASQLAGFAAGVVGAIVLLVLLSLIRRG